MRLGPLYRVAFRYPEHWHVELEGANGLESAHFFLAEGRSGAESMDVSAARTILGVAPTRRTFRTFRARSTRLRYGRMNRLAAETTPYVLQDANNPGEEVRAQPEPGATEIVLDVAELVWEEIP